MTRLEYRWLLDDGIEPRGRCRKCGAERVFEPVPNPMNPSGWTSKKPRDYAAVVRRRNREA